MGIFSFVKPGKKIFDTIKSVGPQVNKTKKEKLTSKLKILQQKTKASGAKLDQTRFEIKNKMPLTFGKSSKKTLSNTEKAKLRNDESKKAFKASEGKTKVFYPPKNFNKGGRVGLKGGGVDMGSPINRAIMTLKERLKNRKKSKIPKNNLNRKRSPMEENRVISKMKSDAQAMGGDFKTASELKPLKGESRKSFESRPSTKFFNKGGRVGLKGGTNLGMQSVKYGLDNNPKITKADPKAKFIAANKKKKSKSPMDKAVRKA